MVYETDDPAVATVNSNGLISALVPGMTNIRIVYPSGEIVTYIISVEDDFVRGDANLDGKVTAEDAAQMLLYAAAMGAGDKMPIYSAEDTEKENKALRQSDTNNDGHVNAEDAANDLLYTAIVGAEGKSDWGRVLGKLDDITA